MDRSDGISDVENVGRVAHAIVASVGATRGYLTR